MTDRQTERRTLRYGICRAIVSEIKRDVEMLVENRDFFHAPPPVKGNPIGITP